MTIEPSVLIVSTLADVATDFVVRALTVRSIPHRRLNTEDFPFGKSLGWCVSDDQDMELLIDGMLQAQPSSIWYRRVRVPSRPEAMQEGVYDFCLTETRAALLGGLMNYSGHWMSRPEAVWRAEFKPYQLALARRAGLAIPRTIVTNEPSLVRDAFDTFGPMIVKPARSGYAVVDGQPYAVFTNRLLAEHLERLEDARLSPAIYQELIPKRYDIRATVVGARIFAAAIDSQSDPAASIDWRRTENPALPHFPIALPEKVEDGIRMLMQGLQLTFGAIDLVQTADDEFVFLEVNPNGQWLWLDDQLDLGITDAIADWLSAPLVIRP